MANTPELTHELVNDVPVLMHSQSLAMDRGLEAVCPRHGNWRGLSPGQVLVTWLAHDLSEGDPRMSQVQDWAHTLPHTLATQLGQPVRPLWVSPEDHAVGLTHLLTLGARPWRWSNTTYFHLGPTLLDTYAKIASTMSAALGLSGTSMMMRRLPWRGGSRGSAPATAG